jgi:hypothetical protein
MGLLTQGEFVPTCSGNLRKMSLLQALKALDLSFVSELLPGSCFGFSNPGGKLPFAALRHYEAASAPTSPVAASTPFAAGSFHPHVPPLILAFQSKGLN